MENIFHSFFLLLVEAKIVGNIFENVEISLPGVNGGDCLDKGLNLPSLYLSASGGRLGKFLKLLLLEEKIHRK